MFHNQKLFLKKKNCSNCSKVIETVQHSKKLESRQDFDIFGAFWGLLLPSLQATYISHLEYTYNSLWNL